MVSKKRWPVLIVIRGLAALALVSMIVVPREGHAFSFKATWAKLFHKESTSTTVQTKTPMKPQVGASPAAAPLVKKYKSIDEMPTYVREALNRYKIDPTTLSGGGEGEDADCPDPTVNFTLNAATCQAHTCPHCYSDAESGAAAFFSFGIADLDHWECNVGFKEGDIVATAGDGGAQDLSNYAVHYDTQNVVLLQDDCHSYSAQFNDQASNDQTGGGDCPHNCGATFDQRCNCDHGGNFNHGYGDVQWRWDGPVPNETPPSYFSRLFHETLNPVSVAWAGGGGGSGHLPRRGGEMACHVFALGKCWKSVEYNYTYWCNQSGGGFSWIDPNAQIQ